MSAVPQLAPRPSVRPAVVRTDPSPIPPLEQGDHLDRAEFLRRYDAMADLKKAELIKGRVYLSSPVSDDHGEPQGDIMGLLAVYKYATPGLKIGDNGTTELDPDNLPQPDGYLRVRPDYGGRTTRTSRRFVGGAPELVLEVAASSASKDLHEKFDTYLQFGVDEYIVWRVYDAEVDYFVREETGFVRLAPAEDGVFRSRVFPGFWLDALAVVADDWPKAFATVMAGLQSPEHAAFVQELARRRTVTPRPE